MVRQTKDTFVKSIERLSSEDRLTLNSMAKALGLPRTTFSRYVKKYDVNINDYKAKKTEAQKKRKDTFLKSIYKLTQTSLAKNTLLKSIERLSSEDRLTQNSMAKALGLSQQTFMAKAKKCDITTEIAAEITAARQEEKKRKTLAMLERKEEEKQKVSLYFMFCLCCVVS